MLTTTQTTSPAPLYMSEAGQIECLEHAPFPGTDTWRWDAWRAITPVEARRFEREVGRPPACEACAAIARRRGLPA
ncbi:MAG: hypothetical protein Q8K82_11210 [Gemmatimonadaceae bacterium]|nr:hypothetical protein [Gemmatimonadaceae bacterium]